MLYEIRKFYLDADLAELCGVPTKALKQAVKRNADRFPHDFMFELSSEEWNSLRSQFVALNDHELDVEHSQSKEASIPSICPWHLPSRWLPMLSSVLKSNVL
jgi:hypothetical protein